MLDLSNLNVRNSSFYSDLRPNNAYNKMTSDFKLTSLAPSDQVKFVEWKIKHNSKLSNGTIIFTYECTNAKDGQKSLYFKRGSIQGP